MSELEVVPTQRGTHMVVEDTVAEKQQIEMFLGLGL